MKRSIKLFIFFGFSITSTFCQRDSLWSIYLSGGKNDFIRNILELPDGSILLQGYTESQDGDFYGNTLESNLWLAKISQSGERQWLKFIGSNRNESIGEWFVMPNGNIVGAGFLELPGKGNDFWMFEMTEGGEIVWETTYGGTGVDIADDIIQIESGGFLVAGGSSSWDGPKSQQFGGNDIWVLNLDKHGALVWEQSYGGSGNDYVNQIFPLHEGYLLIGSTKSEDGNISIPRGASDIWVVQIDKTGQLVREKSFGGSDDDFPIKFQQRSDGNFWLLASTRSTDQQILDPKGKSDIWLLLLDSLFNLTFGKTYGGSGLDAPRGLQGLETGDFVVLAYSNSFELNPITHLGPFKAWLFEVDKYGQKAWERIFGVWHTEFSRELIRTMDDGLLMGTEIVTGLLKEDSDIWLLKLGPPYPKLTSEDACPSFSLFPNPLAGAGLSMRFPEPLTFDGQIRLYDMLGREIFGAPAYFGGLEYSIALPENLPPGQYVVELQSNGLSCREKLVVAR